ncbi:MAG: hypothetical protein K2P76_02785 [Lachnospiraceae bacterium]|nr:hypothetical protein [Lachnospiraceae bacterium]
MDVFKTSYLRSNIIAWLPIQKGDEVLFIENGMEPIKEKLREMTDSLVCTSLSDCLKIKRNFDFVICVGNFKETAEALGDAGADRLSQAKSGITFLKGLLKENGRLVLALENTMGLKYWAGAKEEKSRKYFAGILQDKDRGGFSQKELFHILKETETQGKFYYPFPDYRFAMSIYSDEYQPKTGELSDQVGNFDEERLTMFDETRAGDTLIEEGLFPRFSNSFLLSAGQGDVSLKNQKEEEILFVKFSNDRSREYNIKTFITKSAEGKRHLIKMPDNTLARSHTEGIAKAYRELSSLFADSRLLVNRYKGREEGLELEYLLGQTLEEQADMRLETGEEEKAVQLILQAAEEIRKCREQEIFSVTEGFSRVFGDVPLPAGLMAAPFNDIDAILPNILVQGESWVLIDYEWSFPFPIPVNFIIYRMIHYYVETTAKRRVLKKYDLYSQAGISLEELSTYPLMEEKFQNYIMGSHIPLGKLYRREGKPVYHVKRVLNEIRETERKLELVFYFDRGNGFSEEDSLSFRCEALDGEHQVITRIPEGVKRLRIDPGNEAVTVELRKLHWVNEPEKVMSFVSNGHKLKENLFLFDTRDPNILLDVPQGSGTLALDLKIETMSLEAAEWIAEKIDKKYRLKKLLRK